MMTENQPAELEEDRFNDEVERVAFEDKRLETVQSEDENVSKAVTPPLQVNTPPILSKESGAVNAYADVGPEVINNQLIRNKQFLRQMKTQDDFLNSDVSIIKDALLINNGQLTPRGTTQEANMDRTQKFVTLPFSDEGA